MSEGILILTPTTYVTLTPLIPRKFRIRVLLLFVYLLLIKRELSENVRVWKSIMSFFLLRTVGKLQKQEKKNVRSLGCRILAKEALVSAAVFLNDIQDINWLLASEMENSLFFVLNNFMMGILGRYPWTGNFQVGQLRCYCIKNNGVGQIEPQEFKLKIKWGHYQKEEQSKNTWKQCDPCQVLICQSYE